MKGQKLFVHQVAAGDRRAQDFWVENGISTPSRAETVWLGTLAGTTVAIATTLDDAGYRRIIHLQVAEPMRRKRVALVFLKELQRIAADSGLNGVSVATDCSIRAYFEKVGFRERGAFLVSEREKQG